MKRKILGILFCLITFSVYAAVPAFDGGVVVPVEKISKISFVNYSGLNEIDIEFFIYKETEWVSAGKITECPFTKEIKLATKDLVLDDEVIEHDQILTCLLRYGIKCTTNGEHGIEVLNRRIKRE